MQGANRERWLTRGLIALIVVGVAGGMVYVFTRPAKRVTVQASHQECGRCILEGTVGPRPSEANLELRALEYRGRPLDLFPISDGTATIDIYFDPEQVTRPPEGAQVVVEGHREGASGGDFARTRPFIASRVDISSAAQ